MGERLFRSINNKQIIQAFRIIGDYGFWRLQPRYRLYQPLKLLEYEYVYIAPLDSVNAKAVKDHSRELPMLAS